MPPDPDEIIESMAGCACYSMLDLFVSYDHHMLDPSSHNLTTIQSPIGAKWLMCLPQGWTNVVTIFYENVTFILAPKIPNPAHIMLDDCDVKGPATCYKSPDSSPEVLADVPGICRFVWEHLGDVHRILHCLLCTSTTVSAPKLALMVPEVVILGHKCNYHGHTPDNSKIAKIQDWLPCKSLTNVHTFLGITGYMHIWICNYATISHPLVLLTPRASPLSGPRSKTPWCGH
jgi:hypothetical protein